MRVESGQRDGVMDAERGDQQVHRRYAQTRIARLGREFGGLAPESRRGHEERHGFQPAQERWTLPARSSAQQFKAHLFTERCVLGMDDGIRDPARGGGRALARVVDPDAGVDYSSHALF